jgi:L-serine dehydratase
MYKSIADILQQAKEQKKQFWEIVLEADMESRNVSAEESLQDMEHMYDAMKDADSKYDGKLKSASGMSGGNGSLLDEYNASGKNLCGAFLGTVMARAIKMGESNACMKRIVAAPTAGSCGVLPAILISYEEYGNCSKEEMIRALYVAAGIGKVIGENASISGAYGGCQAEIGTASAMAAGALAYLQGGDNSAVVNALALALKNMLGLSCDPVGGLVEVPCVKRNSHGAVNAVASAQLALAGIKSVISPDDVIDSMRRIGNEMAPDIKETGKGGLATTESARKIFCQQEKQ